MTYLHHVIRCDGRQDILLLPNPRQRERNQVGGVRMDHAGGVRVRGIDARCSIRVLLARSPLSCTPSAPTLARASGLRKPRHASEGVMRKPSVRRTLMFPAVE